MPQAFERGEPLKMNDLHWLAGLLEGEGSFYDNHRNYSRSVPTISLAMTDEDVVKRAGKILDRKPMGPYKYTDNQKEFWRLTCTGRKAAAWMMTLYPTMSQRRQEKIKEILEHWRKIPARYRREPGSDCVNGHKGTMVANSRGSTTYCPECRKESMAERRALTQ